MTGKLIAIEGIDGSGTTTQIRRVVDDLRSRGHRVLGTKAPYAGSPFTAAIYALLKRPEFINTPGDDCDQSCDRVLAELFAADRLYHWEEAVEPALASYDFVISDRWHTSTAVYQGLKLGIQPESLLFALTVRVPEADQTIVLDVSVDEAEARMASRVSLDSFEKDRELQRDARRVYARMDVVTITSQSIADTTEAIVDVILSAQ